VRETVSASWQHCLVLLWRAMIGMRMSVKTEHQLQDGGAPEYVGRLTRCSSSILVRPSENFCTQLWTAFTWQAMFTVHGQHFFMDILLLPYLWLTNIAHRHSVLSWYTHSGAPPSCNWCSVFTVMHIPIIARHNKTRQCCQLALKVSRTSFKNVGRNLDL